MSTEIKVLDHGFARLVSYMQPASRGEGCRNAANDEGRGEYWNDEMQPDWSGDLEIVRNARVSYAAEWRTGEDAGKDAKLIHRLDRDRHTSPFEAMVFTFEIKAPIFVLRQWHRHRTWAYSEVSARYSELPEEFYVPEPDKITGQHPTEKQQRTEHQHPSAEKWREYTKDVNANAFNLYKLMLADGVPRELARTVLPVATYSHMFATVNLHNLFGFLTLRLDPHAQYEIRVYAEALLKLIEPVCPVTVEAFGNRLFGLPNEP